MIPSKTFWFPIDKWNILLFDMMEGLRIDGQCF